MLSLLFLLLPCVLQDSAEFGRIGRYYAAESMLVWDDKRQVRAAAGMQQIVKTAGPGHAGSGRQQLLASSVTPAMAAAWHRCIS
jgi:hypothetical protein